MKVICPYCQRRAERVGGLVIYPHRQDLRMNQFFLCKACDAYVGCHSGTHRPLGRLADAELRAAKVTAHAVFDQLWRNGRSSRGAAYKWLAVAMGLPQDETHIGMFDVPTCRKVIAVCRGEMARWLQNASC